jgi:hypothetical protein
MALGCRNLSFFDKNSALVFGCSQFADRVKLLRSWFDWALPRTEKFYPVLESRMLRLNRLSCLLFNPFALNLSKGGRIHLIFSGDHGRVIMHPATIISITWELWNPSSLLASRTRRRASKPIGWYSRENSKGGHVFCAHAVSEGYFRVGTINPCLPDQTDRLGW